MVSIHSEYLLSSRFLYFHKYRRAFILSIARRIERERKGKASKQNWLLSFFFLTLQTNSLS